MLDYDLPEISYENIYRIEDKLIREAAENLKSEGWLEEAKAVMDLWFEYTRLSSLDIKP